jgi:NAD(P)-dependent dehydrogenase (short-subunit alcohol dehydrogenase family)
MGGLWQFCSRDLDSAQDTVEMITAEHGKAVAVACDATNEASVESLIAESISQFGGIDILHNNVGASIALGDTVATEMTEEAFDRSFAVNLKSHWLSAKHALPSLRERHGSIVNIASLAVLQAYPFVGYKTMKAAVVALTENLAAGNARYGVRANVILPGLMNTPMAIESRVASGQPRSEVIAHRDSLIPLGGKMGTAWDVAYAALFLHSDEARFITGVTLPVDGGEVVCYGGTGSR